MHCRNSSLILTSIQWPGVHLLTKASLTDGFSTGTECLIIGYWILATTTTRAGKQSSQKVKKSAPAHCQHACVCARRRKSRKLPISANQFISRRDARHPFMFVFFVAFALTQDMLMLTSPFCFHHAGGKTGLGKTCFKPRCGILKVAKRFFTMIGKLLVFFAVDTTPGSSALFVKNDKNICRYECGAIC